MTVYAHMQLATSWPEHFLAGALYLLQAFSILTIITVISLTVAWVFNRWPIQSLTITAIAIFFVLFFRVF